MIALVMGLLTSPADALPMYAQRSGRTCGNCHVSPTLEDPEGWDNPALLDRKCTMSCVACHTDPAGGGLRNTSGRYFGASTASAVHTQERSYSDHGRELLNKDLLWRLSQLLTPDREQTEERTIPSDFADAQAGMGQGQTGNAVVAGRAGDPIVMSFWDGRYGSMNADPVLQLGGDFRLAWYSGTSKVFPMQLDLHGSLHPTHHLTFTATAAGQANGPETGRSSPVYARRAFVMVHELPGMSWAKAGVFQPAFGTLLDDHTSPVRTLFEVSQADSAATVIGAEVGTAPNYPFLQASAFVNDGSWVGADADSGWGAAVQGGWRDLAWSLTGHAQVRRRRQEGRGDLEAVGVGWGLSPHLLWESVPVTWLGELTAGRRTLRGVSTMPGAGMSELSFLVRNGVVLKVRNDMWTADLRAAGLQHRHGLGLALSPFPGLTFEGTGRMLITPTGVPRMDALVQSHLWF
ncbi:MAG: hypothetical protein KTR31_31345 [Myxococcales bacterium]|nr:hypothetical protein [Myxococcales bacterium]